MYDFVAVLYQAHASELIAALSLSTNDREAAEDLAHEVFIRAMAQEQHLRRHPDPRAWLFRTGYNLARNRWRLLLRRRHKVAQEHPVLPLQVWDDVLDLRASLQQLSRRQRDVIILHYYVGFNIEEISGLLSCAEGTVRSHLQRARVALDQLAHPKETL